jgi:dipeptidyl aminopeptidase/acylaminoacyl peptidase
MSTTSQAQADDTRPVTIDDLMAIKTVMDPQISPDGTAVAYVVSVPNVPENKHNTDIWLVSVDGAEPIQLTNGGDMDQTPRWSPDGRTVAFMSVREGAPQIYLINPRGGEARQLTEIENGVQGFAWSPSGDRILYLSQDVQSEEQKTAAEDRDGVIVVDAEFQMNHLHAIDIASNETTDITAGDFTVTGFSWSPDGREIVFARQPTGRVPDGKKSDIYKVSSSGGELEALVVQPGSDLSPEWSPDGRSIVFISDHAVVGEIGSPTLAIVPAAGGAPRRLGEVYEESPSTVHWSADSRSIYIAGIEGVSYRFFRVSLDDDSVTALSPEGEVFAGFSLSADRQTMAALKHSSTTPPEVFVSEVSHVEPRRLTFTNPQLDALALGTMEAVRWQSTDGTEIEGILLKPASPLPCRLRPTRFRPLPERDLQSSCPTPAAAPVMDGNSSKPISRTGVMVTFSISSQASIISSRKVLQTKPTWV